MMPKKSKEQMERSVDFYPTSKRGSEGAREEQIALHGVNHLGGRGRRSFHIHEILIHAVFPDIMSQDKLVLIQ
jgi:hypothetical protein